MPSGQRVYVGNIPSDTRERDVEKFFKVSQEIQSKRFLRESNKNSVLFMLRIKGPFFKIKYVHLSRCTDPTFTDRNLSTFTDRDIN